MNHDQARQLMRYRNKVNRELQARHGFAVAVTAPVLVSVIDEGWRGSVPVADVAAIVSNISAYRLARPSAPTRGNQQ